MLVPAEDDIDTRNIEKRRLAFRDTLRECDIVSASSRAIHSADVAAIPEFLAAAGPRSGGRMTRAPSSAPPHGGRVVGRAVIDHNDFRSGQWLALKRGDGVDNHGRRVEGPMTAAILGSGTGESPMGIGLRDNGNAADTR